ncbi:flagellar motor switch protein FliG [Leifsonia sp. EB34]|uniref:flagellar motor switch protein FliG n=1 Tax=Leifsonia sp. EB34 TaxID=3156303 RepID=UPI003517836C
MTDAKVANLTGAQKAALILMNLDQAAAARVMQQFSETESAEIAAEIVALNRVDRTQAEAALEEFHELAVRHQARVSGGRSAAIGLLEASFGTERAAGVMSRVASSLAGRAFEFLDTAEPAQIALLLDGELSQTMATVLAHLRADQASRVLAALKPEIRTDVAHCIATMGSVSPEVARTVADTLRSRAGSVVKITGQQDAIGGVQPLVDIINRSSVANERALLEELDERDPELAAEVRSRMLTFADIVKLEPRDVQQVLRGIDVSMLAIAMKGSPDATREVIRANLSERNLEVLDEESSVLGSIRLSRVEEARAEIVRAIRDLEAEGQITVHRSDEDEYVE